jgi:hypothetical protein
MIVKNTPQIETIVGAIETLSHNAMKNPTTHPSIPIAPEMHKTTINLLEIK